MDPNMMGGQEPQGDQGSEEAMLKSVVEERIQRAMAVRDYDTVSKFSKKLNDMNAQFQKARKKMAELMMEAQNSSKGGQ